MGDDSGNDVNWRFYQPKENPENEVNWRFYQPPEPEPPKTKKSWRWKVPLALATTIAVIAGIQTMRRSQYKPPVTDTKPFVVEAVESSPLEKIVESPVVEPYHIHICPGFTEEEQRKIRKVCDEFYKNYPRAMKALELAFKPLGESRVITSYGISFPNIDATYDEIDRMNHLDLFPCRFVEAIDEIEETKKTGKLTDMFFDADRHAEMVSRHSPCTSSSRDGKDLVLLKQNVIFEPEGMFKLYVGNTFEYMVLHEICHLLVSEFPDEAAEYREAIRSIDSKLGINIFQQGERKGNDLNISQEVFSILKVSYVSGYATETELMESQEGVVGIIGNIADSIEKRLDQGQPPVRRGNKIMDKDRLASVRRLSDAVDEVLKRPYFNNNHYGEDEAETLGYVLTGQKYAKGTLVEKKIAAAKRFLDKL